MVATNGSGYAVIDCKHCGPQEITQRQPSEYERNDPRRAVTTDQILEEKDDLWKATMEVRDGNTNR